MMLSQQHSHWLQQQVKHPSRQREKQEQQGVQQRSYMNWQQLSIFVRIQAKIL